jgi:uncharacterized membrane protein
MLIFFLTPLLIIFLIIGAIAIIFAYRKGKVLSPEESEETFNFLKREIEKWQKEGLIQESQAQKIIGKYLAFREEKKIVTTQAKIVKIFSIFGAILIGIGVILYIGANWGKLPSWLVTILLLLATLGVYFEGWWLKYKKKTHPKIGEALIFLGSLLFGANLILNTQLYHIRIEYSNLILVWALAILPIAYLDKSSLILALSSILTLSWGIFSFYSLQEERFSREFYFPPQYYLSLFFILAMIVPLAYKLKSIKVQSLNLTEIFIWLGFKATLDWFKEGENIMVSLCYFFLLIGVLTFFLGEIHRHWKKYLNFKEIYYRFGLIMILLTSFILTFPQIYEIGWRKTSFEAVFFNFVLFAEICGAIYFGIQKREEFYVNLATLFFALLIFARYFSLTWTLQARAFIFILGGILLILGSYWIDKMRRKILEKIY